MRSRRASSRVGVADLLVEAAAPAVTEGRSPPPALATAGGRVISALSDAVAAVRPAATRAGLLWYELVNRYGDRIELHGRRLVLRPLVVTDHAARQEVLERCRAWLAAWYSTGSEREADDRSSFAARCARQARWRQQGSSYWFGIFVSGRFAGEIHLSGIETGPFESGSVGYWIDEALAGRGLAPEALVAVAQFAFERVGLHRVEAVIVPENAPSRRVAEKIGLRPEGVAERYLRLGGTWTDCLRYAMTKEEWDDRRALLVSTWLEGGGSADAGVRAGERKGEKK